MHKRVLAGLALALIVVFGLATPSFAAPAQSETNYANPVAKECAKLLAEGRRVDDCQQAPSPILPPWNEVIWGIISFTIVVVLLGKFAWPGLKKGMEDRSAKIAGDIGEAETQRAEAEQVLAEYREQLSDARNESARIIEEARKTADEMRQTLQAKAEADMGELRARATADIASAKQQAIADLRSEVAALAIGAAEQVVGHNLDAATNQALVEAYIDQVGASN